MREGIGGWGGGGACSSAAASASTESMGVKSTLLSAPQPFQVTTSCGPGTPRATSPSLQATARLRASSSWMDWVELRSKCAASTASGCLVGSASVLPWSTQDSSG